MAPDNGGWDSGFRRNGATSAARRPDQTRTRRALSIVAPTNSPAHLVMM